MTFSKAESCKPCVDAYLQSNKLRATFVGKRKEEEENANDPNDDDALPDLTSRERDRESVEERKLRQEAEREKLLRQMENDTYDDDDDNVETTKQTPAKKRKSKSLFPPHFPRKQSNERNEKLSFLEKLEQMEGIILKDLIAPNLLRAAKVSNVV